MTISTWRATWSTPSPRRQTSRRATPLWGARLSLARQLLRLPARTTEAREVGGRGAASLRGRKHSVQRDRDAIAYHYDVSNAFYRLFLDERIVYSCAYFQDPSDALDAAQVAKLDLICRKLRLQPGQRLLDVGCGWGVW